MKKPYIGETGFTSREQVEEVLKVVPAGAKRKLMVGVLVSSKSIVGIPNNHPKRYPRPEKLAEVFINHPDVLNFAHIHTKDADELSDLMYKVTELGGKNFHGFQLNVTWPSVYVLMEYRRRNPDHQLVLQCGRESLVRVGNSPLVLAKKVSEYVGICDYALIDQSMGDGKPLEPKFILDCLDNLRYLEDEMNFVMAGGLRPGGLDVIKSIIVENPNVSIDTETWIRDADDNLIVSACQQFYSEADELYEGCMK